MEETRKNPIWFDSILVGIIFSCVGYLVAYYYEKTFLSYFGLPSSVISLNITTIINPFAYILKVLAGSFIFIFAPLDMIYLWFLGDQIHKYISKFLLVVSPVIFVITYRCYLYLYYSIVIDPSPFIILFIFIFIYFVSPIFKWKGTNGYKNKLEKQYHVDTEYPGLVGLIGKKMPFMFHTFLISAVLVLMAKDIGLYNAITKDYFYINPEVDDEIIIRIYDNKIISSKIDKKFNTIKNQFSIYKISNKKILLMKQYIGPLKVEKVITNSTKHKNNAEQSH